LKRKEEKLSQVSSRNQDPFAGRKYCSMKIRRIKMIAKPNMSKLK